jgi:Fe2+ or Zn2+ uptake regulation protein
MCTTTQIVSPLNAEAVRDARGRKEHVSDVLRQKGYALTTTRMALIEVLADVNGHICAEHLQAMVRQRHPDLKMNKTTVYRNLDTLIDLKLLAEMKDSEGRAQYELSMHSNQAHLKCVNCGAVQHMDEQMTAIISRQLTDRFGFTPNFTSYPIAGLCDVCRSNLRDGRFSNPSESSSSQ